MFVNTLNNMGYQATILDEYSKLFVKMAAGFGSKNEWCLEIGCGYGVAALDAINEGAKIYCNDLDARHLEELKNKIDLDHRNQLNVVAGDFREVDLPTNFFSGILCSRVLHFFNGRDVENAITRMHSLLKTGGKLVLISETPFLGNWKKFYSRYIENKKNKDRWPGLIENVYEIEDSGRSENLPKLMHFFDIDTMVRVMVDSGFTVEKIEYIDRSATFPKDILLDGRESVALVASKL